MSTRSTRKRMAVTPKVEKKNEMEITDEDVEAFARITGGPKAERTFREIHEDRRRGLDAEFEQEIYDIIQEPGFLSGRDPKNLTKLMPTGVKELDALEAHPAKRRRITQKQVDEDVFDILADPSFVNGGKRHNKKAKSQKKRAAKKGKTQKKRAGKKAKTHKKRK